MSSRLQNPKVRLTPWNGTELDRLVGVFLERAKTASSRAKHIHPVAVAQLAGLNAGRQPAWTVGHHPKR